MQIAKVRRAAEEALKATDAFLGDPPGMCSVPATPEQRAYILTWIRLRLKPVVDELNGKHVYADYWIDD